MKNSTFTEEVSKTLLSANIDKRIQSIDLLEVYAYVTNEKRKHKKIKSTNIIKQDKI